MEKPLPSDAAASSTLSEPPTTPVIPKKGGRTGKGARNRKQEQSRGKANERIDQQLKEQLDDKLLIFKSEDIFGTRVHSVTIPQLGVNIDTSGFVPLINAVVNVLYGACKIQGPRGVPADMQSEHDRVTLTYATAYQLDAKLYYAQLKTDYATILDLGASHVVNQCVDVLDENVLPIALAIGQIGRVTLNGSGQTFVPRIDLTRGLSITGMYDDNNAVRRSLNLAFDQGEQVVVRGEAVLGPHGYPMYARVINEPLARQRNLVDDRNRPWAAVYEDPNMHNWFGALTFHEFDGNRDLTFIDVSRRMVDLCGRIRRKLGEWSVVGLSLSKGIGGLGQLIGMQEPDLNALEVIAWSARRLPQEAYTYAVALRLPQLPLSGVHVEEAAAERVTVKCTALQEKLASILTHKLKQ